jgi:4-nitrophenyl phosphatase
LEPAPRKTEDVGAALELAREAIGQARVVLLDWDGCIAINDRPSPAAIAFIRQNHRRVAVVSNNTTHLPEAFSEILARAGAEIPAHRILLAGAEALARAAEVGASRTMVLGDNRMKAYGRNLGLSLARENADLVVLLRDTRFTYAKLERAANALRAGARLIVANPDLTHPGADDRIVPETGALLAALQACTAPLDINIEIVGKPRPVLFEKACRALDAGFAEAVMIGDNPRTDVAGAQALGLRSVLVGRDSPLTFEHLLEPATARSLRLAGG